MSREFTLSQVIKDKNNELKKNVITLIESNVEASQKSLDHALKIFLILGDDNNLWSELAEYLNNEGKHVIPQIQPHKLEDEQTIINFINSEHYTISFIQHYITMFLDDKLKKSNLPKYNEENEEIEKEINAISELINNDDDATISIKNSLSLLSKKGYLKKSSEIEQSFSNQEEYYEKTIEIDLEDILNGDSINIDKNTTISQLEITEGNYKNYLDLFSRNNNLLENSDFLQQLSNKIKKGNFDFLVKCIKQNTVLIQKEKEENEENENSNNEKQKTIFCIADLLVNRAEFKKPDYQFLNVILESRNHKKSQRKASPYRYDPIIINSYTNQNEFWDNIKNIAQNYKTVKENISQDNPKDSLVTDDTIRLFIVDNYKGHYSSAMIKFHESGKFVSIVEVDSLEKKERKNDSTFNKMFKSSIKHFNVPSNEIVDIKKRELYT